jgi:uncharacterized protein (TIGR03067 family)
MFRLSLVAMSVVGLLTAAEPKDEKKVDPEAKSMDGTWELVSAELGGQKLPDEIVKTFSLMMKDGKYTVKSGGPDDKGTVKYDATKKPKELDVIGEEGPNKGKTFLAIYEHDGDALKVCYDLEGKKRPTEFKTETSTKQFLAVYKRKKE